MNTKSQNRNSTELSETQVFQLKSIEKDITVLVNLYKDSIEELKSDGNTPIIGNFGYKCHKPMVLLKSLYYHGATLIDVALGILNQDSSGNYINGIHAYSGIKDKLAACGFLDDSIAQEIYCFSIYRNKFIAHLKNPVPNIYSWNRAGELRLVNVDSGCPSRNNDAKHCQVLEKIKQLFPDCVNTTLSETVSELFYGVPWYFNESGINRKQIDECLKYFGGVESLNYVQIEILLDKFINSVLG